jgi:hypothetical protein
MSCGVLTGSVSLATVGAAGRLVDVADLNRDGHNDLIFQNRTNGQPSYSYLNGFTTVSSGYIGAYNAGLSAWTLVAVKDFNADGRPDLVWQTNSSTTVSLWIMNGVTLVSGVNIPNTTNLVGWKLIAVPDLNKDGRPDLLWQHANYVTGAPNTKAYWHLNSSLNYTSSGYINSSFNTNRKLIGTLEIK